MDLTLGLEDTHVVVTGGAGLIGTKVVDAFLAAGANVTCIDIAVSNDQRADSSKFLGLVADITDEVTFTNVWGQAERTFGPVSCCVALASLDLSVLPHVESAADMDLSQFRRTLDVNVSGTFLTARTWLRGIREARREQLHLKNVGLIIVGSESGSFGERGNPDYATSKSAVQGGLLMSLKADAPRIWEGARVNAIAPGPVDTPRFQQECKDNPEQYWLDCQATTALGEPVPIVAIAKSILFLASENFSGHIHGQVLSVDSGKQGKVMWPKKDLP